MAAFKPGQRASWLNRVQCQGAHRVAARARTVLVTGNEIRDASGGRAVAVRLPLDDLPFAGMEHLASVADLTLLE